MKNINFIKVSMENFSCYQDKIEFNFENNKIKLITGPNGAGKSTLFSAVQFTLYGSTPTGLKSDDVVNNTVGKNCHTYVEFTIEHEDNIIDSYRVDRYVKDSKFGDTVLIFKNGEAKPYKKGHKEVLPEIERLLVPQRLFMNTLLFGQKVKDFFTDLTDNEKKDIFRKVLQLDNYVLYYDMTNKELKNCNDKLLEVQTNLDFNSRLTQSTKLNIERTKESIKIFEDKKNEEIQTLTQKINDLNDDLNDLIEDSKFYENTNDLELKQVEKEISTTESENEKINVTKNHQLTTLKNSRDAKELEINSKANELSSIENLKKSDSMTNLNKKFQDSKANLTKESNQHQSIIKTNSVKLESNKKEFQRNKVRIDELSSALKQELPTCPTCGKPLDDHSLTEQLKLELSTLEEENSKITQSNLILQTEINESNNELIQIGAKITELNNNYESDYISICGECNEKLEEIKVKKSTAIELLDTNYNKKVDEIESEFIGKQQEITNHLLELQVKEKNLSHLLEEKKKLENMILKFKHDIDIEKSNLSNEENKVYDVTILDRYYEEQKRLDVEYKELNFSKSSLTEQLEILEFWKSGFSSTGIPSLLIDESIPFLNKTVSEYLDMIGGRYVVSFDTISSTKSGEYRDKINVNVLDTQTKANHRKQLSGGQTRIIDIAILLSLCDLQNNVQNMKTNILLLDEIFDSLDDQNIGYVSNLLRTLIKEKSVNIISHRHIDSIESDEVIRLF